MVASAQLAVAPSAASAAEPLVLEPANAWMLDYAAESCTLQRTFRGGGSDLIMQIVSNGDPYATRIVLAGTALVRTPKPVDTVTARLTLDTEPRQDILALNGKAGDANAVAFLLDLGPAFDGAAYSKLSPAEQDLQDKARLPLRPDFERATTNIVVQRAKGPALDIRTGRMSAPLTALRTCVRDLRGSWGLDLAVEDTLSRQVLIRPATVQAFQGSFPTAMNIAGFNAYVPVRVTVDAAGTAEACVVQLDLPEPFKVAVCDTLEKKFDAALDANGQPVRSIYNVSVVYVLQ